MDQGSHPVTPVGEGVPAPPPAEIDGEIEREIGRTRRRIGRTLDALSQKLAARRLLRRGSRSVGAEAAAPPDLEARFRPDPLALGLIGAGVAWLVAENVQLLRRRKREAAIGAKPASSTVAGFCQRGGRAAADLIKGNPLITGLFGLAVGAAVAALLPATRREQQLVARAREDLWRQAESLGHRAAARVRNLGEGSGAAGARPRRDEMRYPVLVRAAVAGSPPKRFGISREETIMAVAKGIQGAVAFGLGLVVALAARPAAAQMSSDPAEINACLCLEQGVATMTQSMNDKTRALAAVRQHLADLDAELARERPLVDVNNPSSVDRYKALLDQRDAAYRESIGPVVSEVDQAIARYGALVGQYDRQCALHSFNSEIMNEMRAQLSCPPQP